MMPTFHLRPALASVLLVATCVAGAVAAETGKPPGPQARNEVLALHVDVGPDGRVTASRPMNPALPLNAIAQQYASKLTFTPASKDGKPVASTTCLTLGLAAEPQPDGNFALKLKRAINGPCVIAVGKSRPPNVDRKQGGMVVIGANLRADGHVDASSMAVERAELRVPSAFDQARYEDTAKGALRESHFELDTVAGAPVPAHVSAPFRFGGGPVKPTRREESKRGGPPPMDLMLPSWNATSTQAGVELAKIDYTQP
ncbi:hypothetical protein BH11PSE14_BH11PSE14_04910 [soil metagenome]